jgi:glutamate--cysteine ligase
VADDPRVSSPCRSLERGELRAVLAAERFATSPAGVEGFGLGVEALPVRWRGASAEPAEFGGEGGTHAAVALAAPRSGVAFEPAGRRLGRRRPAGPALGFGLGGLLCAHGGGSTPREAAAALDVALAAAERALAPRGIELVRLGHSPWHAPEELVLRGEPARELERLLDLLLARDGTLGRAVLRSPGTRVRIGLGGTVHRPLRWRAAQLLAPLATAVFASSPLRNLAHDGFKSQRARARGAADPGRTGWPQLLPGARDGIEGYLEFALAARLAGVSHAAGWHPPPRPISFATWMQHGVEGRFPDTDDWRAHLDTLEPEVDAAGCVEFAGLDALPAPFHHVPLVFAAALLTDAEASAAVVARLEPSAGALRERWAQAARSGLLEPELRADAAWAFACAARALVRLPEAWFSGEQKRAFLAYGRRFALRGLTPADELLDLFLECGRFGRAELALLAERWRLAVGEEHRAA